MKTVTYFMCMALVSRARAVNYCDEAAVAEMAWSSIACTDHAAQNVNGRGNHEKRYIVTKK